MPIKTLLKIAPITCLLIGSFVILFIIQVVSGVNINEPTNHDLLTWGANALPFTMGDEPWRLLTSAFLHIGLMHLLFNGFAMYFFGQIAEPMFGRVKFLALFILSAVGGTLLNNYVTWQGIISEGIPPALSAGASGGIMGIGAALLVATLFKVSIKGMLLNLRSLAFIMGINLVYGFAVPGIDNAGHIGGAITGAVIALPFAWAHHQKLKQQRLKQQKAYHNRMGSMPYAPATQFNNTLAQSSLNSTIDTDGTTQISTPPLIADSTPEHSKVKNSTLKWDLPIWLFMIAISIGFYFCWLNLHQQIATYLN